MVELSARLTHMTIESRLVPDKENQVINQYIRYQKLQLVLLTKFHKAIEP